MLKVQNIAPNHPLKTLVPSWKIEQYGFAAVALALIGNECVNSPALRFGCQSVAAVAAIPSVSWYACRALLNGSVYSFQTLDSLLDSLFQSPKYRKLRANAEKRSPLIHLIPGREEWIALTISAVGLSGAWLLPRRNLCWLSGCVGGVAGTGLILSYPTHSLRQLLEQHAINSAIQAKSDAKQAREAHYNEALQSLDPNLQKMFDDNFGSIKNTSFEDRLLTLLARDLPPELLENQSVIVALRTLFPAAQFEVMAYQYLIPPDQRTADNLVEWVSRLADAKGGQEVLNNVDEARVFYQLANKCSGFWDDCSRVTQWIKWFPNLTVNDLWLVLKESPAIHGKSERERVLNCMALFNGRNTVLSCQHALSPALRNDGDFMCDFSSRLNHLHVIDIVNVCGSDLVASEGFWADWLAACSIRADSTLFFRVVADLLGRSLANNKVLPDSARDRNFFDWLINQVPIDDARRQDWLAIWTQPIAESTLLTVWWKALYPASEGLSEQRSREGVFCALMAAAAKCAMDKHLIEVIESERT